MRRKNARRRNRSRSNPKRRRRRRSRVHGYSYRRRGSGRRVRVHGYSRRRNPRSSSWKAALFATGLGMVGGALAYGLDWGVSYAPVAPAWQAVIMGVSGGVISVGVAKFGNEAFAAGIAGGTGAMLAGRVREAITLASFGKQSTSGGEAKGVFGSGASRVYDRGAQAVFQEAGAMTQRTGARSAGRAPSMSPHSGSFKEAGVSRYIPGPVRWFGPRSWAYGPQASGASRVRYVSAHSSRRAA